MQHYLDFEKELALLDGKVNELRSINSSQNEEKQKNIDIKEIEKKSKQLLKKIYSELTPWHKCQIARHPERPHSSLYIKSYSASLSLSSAMRVFTPEAFLVTLELNRGSRPRTSMEFGVVFTLPRFFFRVFS